MGRFGFGDNLLRRRAFGRRTVRVLEFETRDFILLAEERLEVFTRPRVYRHTTLKSDTEVVERAGWFKKKIWQTCLVSPSLGISVWSEKSQIRRLDFVIQGMSCRRVNIEQWHPEQALRTSNNGQRSA